MKKQRLFKIYISSIVLLASGFLSALIVPKLAITNMGIEAYGLFAALLGLTVIPTFFEFGITPGLTRELSRLYVNKDMIGFKKLARRIRLLTSSLSILGVLAAVGIAVSIFSDRLNIYYLTIAVFLGGFANAIMLFSNLQLIEIRVAGRIVLANLLRALYYWLYILFVIFFFALNVFDVRALFAAQFTSATVLCIIIFFFLTSKKAITNNASNIEVHWKTLVGLALPEQLNRLQSSILPAFERPMMLLVGGSNFIAAYDIAIRLSALVTALPGALAQPLVALFAPNIFKGKLDQNRYILKTTRNISLLFVLGSIALGIILVYKFAAVYYGVDRKILTNIALFIFVGSGINVLTAPFGAWLYADGDIRPLVTKSVLDIIFAFSGILMAYILYGPWFYILIRYLGFIISSAFLLWIARVYINKDHEEVESYIQGVEQQL